MRTQLCALMAFVSMECALAHHSPAMFDQQQRVTLQGTVHAFQWTNPHTYVQLQVKDAQGQLVEWSIEAAAPMYLQQQGWKPSTLKPGDSITVVIAPMRKQGKVPAGLLIEARRADGQPIGKQKHTASQATASQGTAR